MIKTLFFAIILSSMILPQQIDFQSPQNIKLFADFLFCDKDYLRAIEEYEKYLRIIDDDSIRFKIVIGYSAISDYGNAVNKLSLIKKTSPFYEQSKIELLKSLYLQSIDSAFYLYADMIMNSKSIYSNNAYRLKNTSLLLSNNELPEKDKFLIPFEDEERNTLADFYDLKKKTAL